MRCLLVLAVSIYVATVPGLAQEKSKVNPELQKLAGVWKVVATGGHGKVVTAEGNQGHDGKPLWGETTFTFDGDKLATNQEPVVLAMARPDVGLYFAIRFDPAKYRVELPVAKGGFAPIDLVADKNVVLKGIYELKNDELKLCLVNWMACNLGDENKQAEIAKGKERPTNFTTKEGGEHVSYVLRRVKN